MKALTVVLALAITLAALPLFIHGQSGGTVPASGAGIPGGSTTQFQINLAGVFAGIPATWTNQAANQNLMNVPAGSAQATGQSIFSVSSNAGAASPYVSIISPLFGNDAGVVFNSGSTWIHDDGSGLFHIDNRASGLPEGFKASTGALTAKMTTYNNINTVGWGVPAIYGYNRSTAQIAAVASVATYTVGAADGSFVVSANVLVTASTTNNFTVTVAYTDEGSTARTLTLNFSQSSGTLLTAITNTQGVGAYTGIPLHIRAKASTAITIATTGTFTSVTYNVEGQITQIA